MYLSHNTESQWDVKLKENEQMDFGWEADMASFYW